MADDALRSGRRGALARMGAVLALPLAGACRTARAATAASAAPSSPRFDLAALMSMLSRVGGGQASFVEQKFVRTLDAPLTSSGTLSFSAPDRFERHTSSPRAESMVVNGNTVTVSRSGRSRTFTLDAVPELLGMIDAMRGTLTGNAALVQKYFKPELQGSASQWQLTLVPLSGEILSRLRSMQIAGQGSAVQRVMIELTDGDYSVMTITPLAAPAASGASRP